MELDQARNRAWREIDELRSKLSILLEEDFELYLVGSLQTGLYNGAKRSIFSPNADCPFPWIVEADLRLVMNRTHPHDNDIIQKISSLISVKEYKKKQTDHWHYTNVPMTVFYWYDQISEGMGFEWELCINREPWVEIACYWDQLFTPEEREWQRKLRKLVGSIEIPLELYVSFKQRQGAEARWRLVANFALAALVHKEIMKGVPLLPIRKESKPLVDLLVGKWASGESGYRSLDRVQSFLPGEIFELLKHTYAESVIREYLVPPQEPAWVAYAHALQQKFRRRYQTTSSTFRSEQDCIPKIE